MKRFWKALAFAGQVLGIVSGTVGLLTAPLQKGWESFAWGAISLVVLLVPLYMLFPKAVDVVVRLRNYQKLLDSVATTGQELKEANAKLTEIPKLVDDAKLAGQLSVLGALTAAQSEALLNPVAATVADGQLTLVALLESGFEPVLGSRFLMRSSRLTKTRRGIFAMTSSDGQKRVELALVEQHEGSDQFWRTAFQRAAVYDAPPEQVELVADPLLEDLTEKVEE